MSLGASLSKANKFFTSLLCAIFNHGPPSLKNYIGAIFTKNAFAGSQVNI